MEHYGKGPDWPVTPRDKFLEFVMDNLPMSKKRMELVELFDKTVSAQIDFEKDRKYIATQAMQSLAKGLFTGCEKDIAQVAMVSIKIADALLEALENEDKSSGES